MGLRVFTRNSSAALGAATRRRVSSSQSNGPVSFAILLAIWTVSAAVFDCYDPRVAGRAWDTFRAANRAFFATFLVYFAAHLVIPGLIPPLGVSIAGLVLWGACALLTISAGRITYIKLVVEKNGRRRIAVVGTPASWRAASDLLKAIETDYEVVGLVTRDSDGSAEGLKVLGPHGELGQIVRDHQIDEVIVADAGEDPTTMDALVAPYESGVPVRHLSDIFEEVSGRIPVRYLWPHWFAVLPRRPGGGRAYDFVRRSL